MIDGLRDNLKCIHGYGLLLDISQYQDKLKDERHKRIGKEIRSRDL